MTHFTPVPVSVKEAAAYVEKLHRHHHGRRIDKYRVGALAPDGHFCGLVQVGRPNSITLDDGRTLEVIRLCTDGTRNACSFLYSQAARIAQLLGYSRIITYILETEPGTSLQASGWHCEGKIRGHSWNSSARHRVDKAPVCDKTRWVRVLK